MKSSSADNIGPIFSRTYPNITKAFALLGKRRISEALAVPLRDLNDALIDEEPFAGDAEQRASDFDVVLRRAFEIMPASTLLDWLEAVEPTLGFGQPLLAFSIVGKKRLLDVLERLASGGAV